MDDIRKCAECKHYVITNSQSNWNGEPPIYIWGCELWECVFESKENLQEEAARIIEEVKVEMCDKYCKYPNLWDAEKEGKELYESEFCEKCPLNRL